MKKLFTTAALALATVMAAHAESNWQKKKDCAAQAEKVAKSNGWDQWNAPGTTAFIEYGYHYSPKYDSCFLQLWQTDTDKSFKARKLWDAFEPQTILAKWTTKGSCEVDGYAISCDVAQAYMDDRMTN